MKRLMLSLGTTLASIVLLPACSSGGSPGGGGGGPASGAPAYVEAGLLSYDSEVQVAGLPLAFHADLAAVAMAGNRARLERYLNPSIAAQELPLGYQVLLKVFWKAVPEAERYRVYLRQVGGAEQEIASVGSNETELTVQDVLPQFSIVDGQNYQAGVAAVKNGKTQAITWSWQLAALGAVNLSAPANGSSQPSRPNFVWTNARGNPAAAEISLLDANGLLVLGDFWTSTPLPSTATAPQDLAAGTYRWAVINASSSQPAADSRTRQFFQTGHMVLTLPAPASFTVAGGGGDGGGGGGGGGDGGGGGGGAISGTVTAPAGGDINGAIVVACFLVGQDCDEQKSKGGPINTGATASSAEFTLSGLEAGQYNIYGFKDLNGNEKFDDGDWYGIVQQQITPPASGVQLALEVISGTQVQK